MKNKKKKTSIKEYWNNNIKNGITDYFGKQHLDKLRGKYASRGLFGAVILGLIWLLVHPYPIMLAIFTVAPLYIIIKSKEVRENWSWFEFSWITFFCTVGGYIWMDDLMFYDSAMPSWGIAPWSVSWIEPWAGASLEDVLFYPITSLDMYVAILFISKFKLKDFKYKTEILWCYFIVNLIINYLFWSHTGYFSESTGMLFAITAVPMFLYCFQDMHAKELSLFIVFGLALGCGMNYIGTDFGRHLAILFDAEWLNAMVAWWYEWTDSEGVVKHSTVYISKDEYPQWWIGTSPWSIPFFLSWSGTIFYQTAIKTWRKIKRES